MDPTLEHLWSIRQRPAGNTADWAISLLEAGHDSDALRRLTDRHLADRDRDRFAAIVIAELNYTELLDPEVLTLEYERASIDDYFTGLLDGPTLIQRCCNMYWSSTDDNSGLKFWTALADDACQHDGQGICIEYDFIHQEFDTALRSAILQSDRPLPKK
ncbi:MAG: hypothetical protein IT422_15015 [Pirellulaceae bacterium]|nr:hypothetical protein [Pirellulaceae bacterium]